MVPTIKNYNNGQKPEMKAPPPIRINTGDNKSLVPNDIEMPLADHLEELRQRVFRSLIAVICAAGICLLFIRPLVRILETPAGSIHFLQVAPGEFLFVSIKVAGYAGLTAALPYVIFQALAFILPGLTAKERNLIAPAVAGSTILFLLGIIFAWGVLVPAALKFLVSYGADVVEPLWSIEKYLDFVLILLLASGLSFQLPVLQLLLGALGILNWKRMISAWRWVVMTSALAGAILTPSTDPITMLLLGSAITILFLIGVALVAFTDKFKEQTPSNDNQPSTAK